MLDRMVKTVRQREVFCREDTPTEQRVLGAFLYHAGLSYRKVERFVERSYEAVRQWYHRLAELFEPDRARRPIAAVDETKLFVDGEERYVWAAIDVDTFGFLRVSSAMDVEPHRGHRWVQPEPQSSQMSSRQNRSASTTRPQFVHRLRSAPPPRRSGLIGPPPA